jgi:pimeloyl-ACP methyl ester carboxylesterase
VAGEQIRLPDGRLLEIWPSGPAAGLTLVWHHGTPGCGLPSTPVAEAAAERRIRLVSYSRAGYSTSDRCPGRTVADVGDDIEAVLDHLGVEQFVTAGTSGGGPHALACGAGLPGRCRAVAVIAGVAPYEPANVEWTAGMAAENIEEFSLSRQGEAALRPFLTAQAATLASITGSGIVAALGGLLPPVDQAVLTGEVAGEMATSMREGLARGTGGWLDDDLAFVRPWGFGLADVRVPVTLWQGGADLMVPRAHGTWQAARLPDVRAHILPDEGHLSITVASIGPILDELLGLAGGRL